MSTSDVETLALTGVSTIYVAAVHLVDIATPGELVVTIVVGVSVVVLNAIRSWSTWKKHRMEVREHEERMRD